MSGRNKKQFQTRQSYSYIMRKDGIIEFKTIWFHCVRPNVDGLNFEKGKNRVIRDKFSPSLVFFDKHLVIFVTFHIVWICHNFLLDTTKGFAKFAYKHRLS